MAPGLVKGSTAPPYVYPFVSGGETVGGAVVVTLISAVIGVVIGLLLIGNALG